MQSQQHTGVKEIQQLNLDGPAEYIPYFEKVHEIFVIIALMISEGLGMSAQMRRLGRAFAARIYEVWMKM